MSGQDAFRKFAAQLQARARSGGGGGGPGPAGVFAGGGLAILLIGGGLALNASLFNGTSAGGARLVVDHKNKQLMVATVL